MKLSTLANFIVGRRTGRVTITRRVDAGITREGCISLNAFGAWAWTVSHVHGGAHAYSTVGGIAGTLAAAKSAVLREVNAA